MTRRRAGALAVLLLASGPPATTAEATAQESESHVGTTPTTGVCNIREAKVCAGLGASSAPLDDDSQPVTETGSANRRGERPARRFRWERVSLAEQRQPWEFSGCIQTVTGRAGTLHDVRRVDVATGRTVQAHTTCVVEPDPPPRRSDTENPPRPAPERIWSEVPLPQPAWGLNPVGDGLTGLLTLLWDPRGDAPVSTTVDLGGFTATATARPVLYEWTMWEPGDPENRNPYPLVTSRVPGTESKPAATYTYETKGDYTVTYTVTWEGTYTLSGPGVNEVVDLGTTTTSSTRTYHVTEVRAVLKGSRW